MALLQNERIDTAHTMLGMWAPPEILKETEERIHMEMAILKAHGEDPNTVNCIIADEILQSAPESPRMPQVERGGIELPGRGESR